MTSITAAGADAATRGLRLLVYDATCAGAGWAPGLSTAWRAGAALYRRLGRIDAARGVASWAEALEFLGSHEPDAAIEEVQFWGHGRFGRVFVGKEPLGVGELGAAAYADALDTLATRLARSRAPLVWLRTCEAFGGPSGHTFARALSRRLGCRVAGHTHVIGVVQSGLVSLAPGGEPRWPTSMGLGPLGEDGPGLASSPLEPNTVHFLTGRLPTALQGPPPET
ncbi:MAG: DUF4347 domain-containing protein [Myxococcales bacterium]|jgi:hypothetical protein|nr:DUF4347 domain-containing protein [Myxococcales bacterium]MBL0195340.1 DUF4347 domain-containing protein [Myxococcales bacterium]HQY62951.1 DUF4347 domain-containing protein [Polyangiaceae bacterium]